MARKNMASRPKQPWDIPDRRRRGDPTRQAIFVAVGDALSEWELVEEKCAEFFAVFVAAPRKSIVMMPAIRAYGSVLSFRARADMLLAAATAYFHTRPKKNFLKPQFTKLLEECRSYAARRNEIAHGRVHELFHRRYAKTGGRRFKSVGHYLMPSFYNPKKFGLTRDAAYLYTAAEIIYFRTQFTKLRLRLHGLHLMLTARIARPSSIGKSLPRGPGQPR